MKFSIYDYKNMFLDGTEAAEAESRAIYVGTTKTEVDYQYMKGGPAGKPYSEGGDISTPYVAEFRLTGVTDPDDPVTLTVLGAKAVVDGNGKPLFTGNSPDAPTDYTVVGQLTIPEPDAEDPIPYRVAVSSNKYKWFKAKVEGGTASAFLIRG
jgi:hypothetical protein